LKKPTKEQIAQFYRQTLDRCLDAFSRLDEKEWEKKASDHWTAREHLAHLATTHEEEGLRLTEQALAGEPANIPGFAKREDILAFRKKTLDGARNLPASELLPRVKTGFEEHLATLNGLSEADLDKPAMSPAWDRPGTVRDLFFASYLFLAGQYQEIRKVSKKKVPHWIESGTPDQVNYHLSRTFHYMPLIFWSSRGADMTTTYQFTMDGEGGGQWNIQIADGKAESADGPAEPFDAEIKTKPEHWMDLSMGELNPVMAITMRKVKLGGNAALAMKLSSLFSAE